MGLYSPRIFSCCPPSIANETSSRSISCKIGTTLEHYQPERSFAVNRAASSRQSADNNIKVSRYSSAVVVRFPQLSRNQLYETSPSSSGNHMRRLSQANGWPLHPSHSQSLGKVNPHRQSGVFLTAAISRGPPRSLTGLGNLYSLSPPCWSACLLDNLGLDG